MEKRTAKAGIHEKDRSTTSSSVHTVMSSSAPSTTHLSILRGSEKKCTPILTIALFFTITLVFSISRENKYNLSLSFFHRNSAFTNIPANGPPDWQKLHGTWLSYSPYPLLFEKPELPVSWIFGKTKERVKEYCPDPEGLFKGIEPLFPRRPPSSPWRPSSSLRAAGFTLYKVRLHGDEDGRREKKPRTSQEWPPKGLIFDP